MFYALLKTLHLLAVVTWVGGMAFVLLFLRPALVLLQPPDRLKLMREVLRRFFAGVTLAVAVVLGTGMWMLSRAGRALAQGGGSFAWPLDWMVMVALGLAMMAIYGFVRVVLFPRFADALERGDAPAAAAGLGRIRTWVSVNLALGVAVIVVVVMV